MITPFDIEKIIKEELITNELDYTRTLVADRKLRLLAKGNTNIKKVRTKLRDIIEKYENSEWALDKIDGKCETISEQERLYIEKYLIEKYENTQ